MSEKKGGKGGGARKVGQNRRQPSKARYASREAATQTPKTRRILKRLRRGEAQPGWFATGDGKRVMRG